MNRTAQALTKAALRALRESRLDVLRENARLRLPLLVSDNGRVRKIPPSQFAALERELSRKPRA